MKVFPVSEVCENDMIAEVGAGSERLLTMLWNKFPSLRNEFADLSAFLVFGKSVADGRTKTYGPGGVITSKRP